MKILDWLRDRVIVRTNDLGAERFPVGSIVDIDGQPWRVTRHLVIPTVPWATIRVYGVPA